jgi:hypothetical protein
VNIPSLIRRGVKTVERVAGSVRVPVLHFPMIGRDAFDPVYPDVGTPALAFMEFGTEDVTQADGTTATSKSKLTFFEPIAVSDNDQFEVPDGKGGMMRVNVLAVKGPMDTTKVPYFAEVMLGDRRDR